MHIALIVSHYNPDGGAGAPLFTMLSEGLVRRGHSVTVLTAVPHYPTGRVPRAYRNIFLKKTQENGVKVIRVGLPSVKRENLYQRLLQLIVYQVGAAIAAFRLNPEIVLTGTPALEVWLPYIFLARLRRKPAVYSVYDLYPEVGIRSGIFRNPTVIRAVTWLERSCIRAARKVHILSESFVAGMNGLGVEHKKIRLISIWTDTDLIHPLPRKNAFSAEQNLNDRFVVLYSGNMGATHGIESIVNAAALLKNYPDIQFVFVGDGRGKAEGQERAKTLALSNILFVPYQPRDRLAEVLASADISLVSLQKGFGSDSLPSKTFSIFASGRPLIATVDPDSATWNIIVRSRAGLCVPPENPHALADAILTLRENPALRQSFGEQGRAYALAHHSPEAATLAFEELLREAVEC